MIIDISKHQGAVNWDALAPHLDFIVIKASGKTKDPQFDRNAAEATRRGIPWHTYHFLYCTTEARARQEARRFSDSVGDYRPLFWVLDCEREWGVSKKKARAVAEAFEAELRRLRGHDIKVAVYIGHNVYMDYALDYEHYAYVWIPRYRKVDVGLPNGLKPDYPCHIWQYSSNGTAPGIRWRVDMNILTGAKPMSFFTGQTENTVTTDTEDRGGETYMAIDFLKYIMSTGTHYIANSGKDERNQYRGGQAGDQSGHEYELKKWYSRPWSVILRWPDPAVGLKIAQLGIAAALNDKIGYDQGQRKTYWTQLEKAKYDPSRITTACEEDCTAGVTANCKAVGYLLDIKGLKDLAIDTYSGNMRSRFVAAGFKALTASKYLTSPNELLPGDILLYEGHHAATNISYGSKVCPSKAPELTPISGGAPIAPDTPDTPAPEGLSRGDHGSAVTALQRALLVWNPDCLPKYGADGDFGSETEAAVKDFQRISGLPVTGVYDEATRKLLTGIGEPKSVIITGGSVNVRSAPGTDSAVLGVVYENDSLPYQGETRMVGDRAWYLVAYYNQNGWVSSKYSRIEDVDDE